MTMVKFFKLRESKFRRQFEIYLFESECLSLKAHLRLGYLHLRVYGIEVFLTTIQNQKLWLLKI